MSINRIILMIVILLFTRVQIGLIYYYGPVPEDVALKFSRAMSML